MQGQKPYMPPPKNDPMMSGVNILDALALAYKAIKDLVAKKPPKPSGPVLPEGQRPVLRLLPDDGRRPVGLGPGLPLPARRPGRHPEGISRPI